MRRFLWVLGATLILALLPLTGHIAFAAEHPQTAVTGASATTDNLAEATTDPAVATRSDHADHADHADRHDTTGPAESAGATEGDDASSAGAETTDPRASRHAADDGGVTASDGDQGSDPVAAPVTDPGPGPVTQPEASTGTGTGQTSAPSAPVATTAGSDSAPSDPAPAAAAPATDPGNADSGDADSSPSSSPLPGPAGRPSPDSRGGYDGGPLAQNSDRGSGDKGIVLPPAPLDLNRLIARLTAQGLCTPSGSEAGDLSCGGGAVQLCLRATATGVSLSCAAAGGGTARGGSEHPGTNNPPPVTQPGGNQPGGNQSTGSQPGGGSDPGPGAEPVASDPVASVSGLASGAELSSDLASLSQPADAIEGGDSVVVGRPISFAPAGAGVSGPAVANVAALPAAPASNAGLSAAGLNAVRNMPSLTNLMRPGNAYSTHFAPKLSVLSLVDHAPAQPQLPTLVVPRLPMLDPFAGLPAVAMSTGTGAGQTAPHTNSEGAQPVAAAPATGARTVAAPAPLPVSHPAQSQQPSGTLDRSPSRPSGVWTGPLPSADVPSPVTPLRLLLILLASGCFVAAAMTRSKRHRPRARAAPVPKRPGRLI